MGLLVAAAFAGCSRESPERAEARRAADRFLVALAANDLAALRSGSTCILASGAVRGGAILRVEPIRRVMRASLDSLAAQAAEGERRAEAEWSASVETTADSLHERMQALARRSVFYRNALRAVRLSLDGAEPAATDSIQACRMRVRLRWGGARVGPAPIDREHLLHALASPGGKWIVFSIDPREDDPRSEPI